MRVYVHSKMNIPKSYILNVWIICYCSIMKLDHSQKKKERKHCQSKKKNGGNTFSASEIQRIEEISNI